jgi:hypothetical protein
MTNTHVYLKCNSNDTACQNLSTPVAPASSTPQQCMHYLISYSPPIVRYVGYLYYSHVSDVKVCILSYGVSNNCCEIITHMYVVYVVSCVVTSLLPATGHCGHSCSMVLNDI